MIAQETIDQILDRVDIVDIISEYVTLKRAGRNFKACCPFHNEKTPSFVVSPEKQIYHCFGCNVGGNAIQFLMSYENMDFRETVEVLANRAGIPVTITTSDNKEISLNNRMMELNNIATGFYQTLLVSADNKKTMDYLKGRGLSVETVRYFRLGYSPDNWESLKKYCLTRKIPLDLLKKCGLVVEKNGKSYDRFRNRVVFPIFNERSKIVAFGARVLDNSLPKYINSPESIIYNKSNVLFGLNFARKAIREKDFAILVEGYLDVIIPYQHGIENIIATSGTALTQRQVEILRKYTNSVVIVYDSDSAGQSASLRGVEILLEHGMNVKLAALPDGYDPDAFVRKFGAEKFDFYVRNAQDIFDYKLEFLIGKYGIKDVSKISEEMIPTIAKVSNIVVQSKYLRRLSEQLGVHEEALRSELKKRLTGKVKNGRNSSIAGRPVLKFRNSEIHLLGLALINREVFCKVEETFDINIVGNTVLSDIFSAIKKLYESNVAADSITSKILSRFQSDRDLTNILLEALKYSEIISDSDKVLEDCIIFIKKELRDENLKFLTSELKKARSNKNDKKMMELVFKINEIHKEKVA